MPFVADLFLRKSTAGSVRACQIGEDKCEQGQQGQVSIVL